MPPFLIVYLRFCLQINFPAPLFKLLAHFLHAGFGVVRKGDRVYAVGLYARPDGALVEAVPFEVTRAETLAASVSGLADGLRPQAYDATSARARSFSLARLEAAPAGVYQLQVRLPVAPGEVEYLIGPLFAWRPS